MTHPLTLRPRIGQTDAWDPPDGRTDLVGGNVFPPYKKNEYRWVFP